MQVETDEPEVIERIAALDVAKAEVVCCVRVPGPGGQRMQEVRTVSTMTAALLALGDWLAELGVSRVVRSEEHTSELQSRKYLVCRLLLAKKNHSRLKSVDL